MKHFPTAPIPPDAWLAISECNELWFVEGIYSSPNDEAFLATQRHRSIDRATKATIQGELSIIKDEATKSVIHCGIQITIPPCLTARDNWFARYESILETHLVSPLVARVFTYYENSLTDPFRSHKSSKHGPFVWLKGQPLPTCRCCGQILAFVGALDYRGYTNVMVPNGTLVFHCCERCGLDSGEYALTWIEEAHDIVIHSPDSASVLCGEKWEITDYPPVGKNPRLISSEKPFCMEYSFYNTVTCLGDKVGGYPFWIQTDSTPLDRQGQPMVFIGQFVGSPDINFVDAGIAYIFYSVRTGETEMVFQFY